MAIQLGKFTYQKPVLVLAPMAGISDLPFRKVCQKLDVDFTISEMTDVRKDLIITEKSKRQIQFDNQEKNFPKIVQIAGSDPNLMADTARELADNGIDVIDINMGCPAKKVGKKNAGSALLATPNLAIEIMQKIVQAVNIPVTLKTRIGFNEQNINIDYIAKSAQDVGISLISIHGRTRSQRFLGQARFEEIAKVKENLKIPVIANGDISDEITAQQLLDKYHFDGLMIGRAAIGNPWIFRKIKAHIFNLPDFVNFSRQEIILMHLNEMYQHYPDNISVYMCRKHLHAYFQNHPNYSEIKQLINNISTAKQQIELVKNFYNS